jgi:hypothetical protein
MLLFVLFHRNLDLDSSVAFDKEEISENDELFVDNQAEEEPNTAKKELNAPIGFANKFLHSSKPLQRSQDEPESCYYSHTDNYCSTDEHEHIFQVAAVHSSGLHSSDSGADISEQNFNKIISNKSESKDSDFFKIEEAAHHERNNSLPNIFGKDEFLESWEKYWGKNGEQLVWHSWIEKYSDYINPAYLGNQSASIDQATPSYTNVRNFEFDFEKPPDTERIPDSAEVNTEIVISACSPAAAACILTEQDIFGDIWNPLVNDAATSSQNHIRIDADNMLSPRCESSNSSIPFTIGTTDSMTNVTHMTISDYEFCSSKVTSESSKQSTDPMSSADNSDNSSNNSETQMINTEYYNEDFENAMDVDQYWQTLWQKHFQEQFAKHYSAFMKAHIHFKDDMSTSFKSESGIKHSSRNLFNLKKNKSGNKSLRKRSIGKKVTSEILPKLVANMKIMNAQTKKAATDDEGGEKIADSDKKDDRDTRKGHGDGGYSKNTDAKELEAYGLPMSFGKQKKSFKSNNSGDGNRPPNDRAVNLKRR